ncbi:hypothetical protein ScPMuIL_014483 [Solemya velum]
MGHTAKVPRRFNIPPERQRHASHYAPEVLRGYPTSIASDIYSLGVTFEEIHEQVDDLKTLADTTLGIMWSPFLYLLLSLQLIASSLSQDQPYVCNRRWNKVLEHDTAGIVTEGSKVDLTSALSRGAQLRFHVRQWGGNNGYTADIHNAQIVDGNVCAQSLLHISKSSWEGFQPDAYWWFVLICTTGHVHMSRWMVGDHTLRSETKSTVAVTWFTRELGCTEGDDASITPTVRVGRHYLVRYIIYSMALVVALKLGQLNPAGVMRSHFRIWHGMLGKLLVKAYGT